MHNTFKINKFPHCLLNRKSTDPINTNTKQKPGIPPQWLYKHTSWTIHRMEA